MAVPLTLSSVPSQTPYIQYVATASQTVFPYPFEITQDSDLIVLLNGVQQATDSGYTLSGQGATGGGNVTFTTGLTGGTIVTIYRNITISRVSQLTQNGTFFSSTFNNEFNKIYLIMQQLNQANGFALQIPNTNNPAGTTVLTPANYANKYLAFDSNGNPTPAALTSSGTLTQAIISGLLNPQTTAEASAGLTPSNTTYLPWRGEDIRRFGAVSGSDISAILTEMNAIGSAIYIPPGTWPIASNTTVTVPLNVDYGGILTPANGVTLTINASVSAGLYQIFNTASGGSIAGKLRAPFFPVEWWGATGNGRGSGTGAITNGTTTLTDTNGTFTAADVGKTIILVPPQYTTYSPLITTITGYTSATSVTLNAQLAWASGAFTGVDYYYGTDDTVAIKAANATVGQMAKYSGEGSAFYGPWAYAIAFNAGTVYLMTQQLVIGTPGVTASQAIGVGGNAAIAFGISSTTTDCIQMGLATGDVGSSFCALENLFLDGCFSGQDIIYLAGFQNPRLRNVFAQNANRDAISLRPPSGSFIQQGDFQNLYLGPAGRNCFYVGPTGGSFVNECDFLNVVFQYPAVRLPLYSGTTGTAFFVDSTSGTMDSWNVTNYKASVGWANQTGYSPLGAWFYVAASTNVFGQVGITLSTGYCEQGQVSYPIGATTAPFTLAGTSTAIIRVRGFYSSNWGNSFTRADHDGASAFTVAASGTKALATLGQAYFKGCIEFIANITDGTNSDYLRFQAIGTGSGTNHIDVIGTKVTTGTAPTYTLTTSNVSNIMQVNFNNTGGVSLTITYSARVIDNGTAVAFSY